MSQKMSVVKDMKGGMSAVQKTKDKLSPAAYRTNKRQQKGVGDVQKGCNFFPAK